MKLLTLNSVILACFAQIHTQAALLYDNGGPNMDGGAIASDFDYPHQWADNFTIAQPALLTTLNWWGEYILSNSPVVPDNFAIRLFTDTGGLPATLPFFEEVVGAVTRVDTGLVSFNKKVYAHSTTLSTPVSLTADTTYWLSIVNDTALDPNADWYWHRASRFTGDYASRTNNAETWAAYNGSTAAFNAQGAVVPEPSSASLLILSVCVLRKRHRAAMRCK